MLKIDTNKILSGRELKKIKIKIFELFIITIFL